MRGVIISLFCLLILGVLVHVDGQGKDPGGSGRPGGSHEHGCGNGGSRGKDCEGSGIDGSNNGGGSKDEGESSKSNGSRESSGEKSGESSEESSEKNSGGINGENTVENSLENSEENSGGNSRENSGGNSGGENNKEGNSGESSLENSEENSGGNSRENSGGNSGGGNNEEGSSGESSPGGDSGDTKLTYVYNAKLGCYFYNQQHQTVSFLDYASYYTAYYCGQSGEVIIFSFQENSAVLLTAKSSDKVWVAKNQSFEEYVKTNIQLKELYSVGRKTGISFNAISITENIQKKLYQILVTQSKDYDSECGAYGNALQLTSSTVTTTVKGVEAAFTATQTEIRGDVQWTIGVYEGIKIFFNPFGDQISVIKDNDIKIDLSKVLGAKSGTQVLTVFLQGLVSKVDLGKILGQSFESLSWAFTLISGFSGNVCYGFDGFVWVISHLVRFASGEISEQYWTYVLTEYFTSKRAVQVDLANLWKTSITELQKTLQELELDSVFKVFFKATQDIVNNNWVVGKINLSTVIQVIIKAEFKEESVKQVVSSCKNKS